MAKIEQNGILRKLATLSDSETSDSVEDYVAEHGGEGGGDFTAEYRNKVDTLWDFYNGFDTLLTDLEGLV